MSKIDILNLPQSPLWGILPGLITACFGAYKDTQWEGFEWSKFFRSIVLTFFIYIYIEKYCPQEKVIFKISMASMLERCLVEGYKSVIGKQPGKFRCADNTTVENSKDRGWLINRLRNL